MKIKCDKWQVTSGRSRRPARGGAFAAPHPSPVTRHSEKGIALVITLILLSVTLIMALAFLAISRRSSSSVTTAGETTTARLAADSALANAEAQAMAGILDSKNPYGFGLLVSTNYIQTNINNNFIDLTNLQISPRAPVLISPGEPAGRFYLDLNRNGIFDANGSVPETNSAGFPTGATNFEVGDPEWIGVLERPDQPYGPDNKFIARYAFIALPAGNSLDLNAIHNQVLQENSLPLNLANDGYFRNQGIGSWEINLAAFLADLNTNEWDNNSVGGAYQYDRPGGFPNSGAAFADAFALLSYRYDFNYNNLATVQNLFGNAGATAFLNDNIDGYSDGPLMTNTVLPFDNDNINLPWAGSDNTNHFFTPSDLFDTTKTAFGVAAGVTSFTGRLQQAGANVSTYDRYTFYRMLSQLGTDTTPESGRMDLNYDNLDPGSNGVLAVNGTASETNFVPWTPLGFFTNAADRMLRAYSGEWFEADSRRFAGTFNVSAPFGITDIPVWVSNRFVYTPAVNRLLQLAANIYDATVNNSTNGSPDYPDVFRPLFSRDANGTGTNIYITGYTNVVPFMDGAADVQLSQPFDVATISALSGIVTNVPENIYGVPWIIGAKKGFPNFNEFSTENILAVTRRLQVTRPAINSSNSVNRAAFVTNQMYTMSLDSSLGVELWNSYAATYSNTVWIGVNENASLMITNDDHGQHQWVLQPFSTNALFSITSWHGAAPWHAGNPNSVSFIPLTFTGPTLTNSVYRSSYADSTYTLGNPAPGFVPTNDFTGSTPLLFEQNSQNGFYLPQFGVLMTNRLQVFMLDYNNTDGKYRVIDYVHFNGPDSWFNVNSNLADADTVGVWNTTNDPPSSSNPYGLTYGIQNQINYSEFGNTSVPQAVLLDGKWNGDPTLGSLAYQEAFFKAIFAPGNKASATASGITATATNLQLSVQAPYSPTRYISQYATWQANDPLVHYLASDIDAPPIYNTTTPAAGLNAYNAGQTFNGLTNLNLGMLNDRFMPWGGNPLHPINPNTPSDFNTANAYNMGMKDPLVASPDNWDFPTNKFPSAGWLGRVHRGTPWQTVYLKSTDLTSGNTGAATWQTWTGDAQQSFNQFFDAANSAPVEDRLLFDLFTTAFNDNATRGQLSVNQPGLAAWSALLGGVVVLANNPSAGTVTATNIQPAGVYDPANPPPLVQIWKGINDTRGRQRNADGLRGEFEHVGDILGTSQLTEQSPFINTGAKDANGNPIYPGDEVMEWLPQQVMSLLRVGSPRYVIYSYGQALKPAPGGIVTGGPFFGMVTNYQVVSETATRAVVRFDSTVTNINNRLTVTNNNAVIERYDILPPD